MSFDITIAFNKTNYLDLQAKILINSMIGKISEDIVIHITTDRDETDEIIKLFKDNFNTRIYYREDNIPLNSRCKYMLNCFNIETNKDWIIKIELDFVILKHLKILEDILDKNYDIILEPENRKIYDNNVSQKLWRIIYKALKIDMPIDLIHYRENNEIGLPLFGTGLVCVRTNLLPIINERWIPLTKICEQWGQYGIHPNEFGFTALIFDEEWIWKIYEDKYKFNPIGHWRDGEFPSTTLKDDCILPDDTVIFDYHRFPWLLHTSKFNNVIYEIIKPFIDEINKEMVLEHKEKW